MDLKGHMEDKLRAEVQSSSHRGGASFTHRSSWLAQKPGFQKRLQDKADVRRAV